MKKCLKENTLRTFSSSIVVKHFDNQLKMNFYKKIIMASLTLSCIISCEKMNVQTGLKLELKTIILMVVVTP